MTMRTPWQAVVLGSLMIGIAGTAAAEGSGFYMATDAGIGVYPKQLSIKGASPVLSRGDSGKNDFAWSFAMGYHFNPYIAAELGFADLGSRVTELVDASGATTNRGQARVSARGKTLSVLAHVPTGNWDPYFKVGVMQAAVDRRLDGQAILLGQNEVSGFNFVEHDDDLKVVLGLGVRYAFTEQWAANFAVDYYSGLANKAYSGGSGNVASPRVGFAYRF